MNKVAVIPAYEPDNRMIVLLKDLKKNNYDIIVVNDGSNQTYDDLFNESIKYGVVLKHDINMGKGVALKTAFSYIKNNYKDCYIVTLDCDGQHRVEDANKLCEQLKNNKNDLVIGKRIRTNKTPVRSRLGNSITRLVYNISTGIDVYDTQTGLRAFTNKLIPFLLSINGDRYEYEMNVLLESAKNNINIKEIEIETIYFDNNTSSHFSTIKDSYKIYKEILKFSFSSLISFIIDYTLYIIFNIFLNNIILSNIFSRIISSFINYNLNEKMVFKKKNKTSILKYYILAICILILNTIFLQILVNNLFINKYIAKIIVEFVLFILNFIIQKVFVFKNKEEKK